MKFTTTFDSELGIRDPNGEWEPFDDCEEEYQRAALRAIADHLGPRVTAEVLDMRPRPVDDPTLDETDGAHPAWWRGHDRAVEKLRERYRAQLAACWNLLEDYRTEGGTLEGAIGAVVRAAAEARG